MKRLVSINNITKVFSPKQPPALKEINASIEKGQIMGVVGPDGAGKTTLLRMIAGLLLPTEGTVEVMGHDTKGEPEKIQDQCGYMPQKFGLYEELSVMQNLELYADLRGLQGKEKEQRFEELLEFTTLGPFKERLAGALSGGMKQKLGLGCALITKPSLLLLDEPSVGVDPLSRRELWKMVHTQLKEGITVVWSTSYLDEAEKCDNVMLLNLGKLLYHGAPSKLTTRVEGRVFRISEITSDRRALLSKILEEKNVIDGIIQGKEIRVVMKEKGQHPPGHASKVAPRFEDAFIDILGGGPGGRSELADITKKVGHNKTNVIEAKDLTKKFGDFTAANHIDFSVEAGQIFGLLGPNGAGKSTTFKMLCGLLKPTEGHAYVGGLNLEHSKGEARAQIGYMAQKFSLHGNLNVRQNLDFFSGIYNLRGEAQKKAVEGMIKIFHLEEFLNTSAETLPLGYKQRLALACATMHQPAILFLDEPTSGVDPYTRREFWNHINGLVQKGVTILVTTHFMEEAEYCDRIALVYRGNVIQLDTPDALKASVATKENPNPTMEEAFIELIGRDNAAP